MVNTNITSKGSGDEFHKLNELFRQVGDSAAENCRYFSTAQKAIYNDFYHSFTTILNVLDPLQISVEAVTSACSKFDLSPSCKGNGYRSIVNIIESCLEQILMISQQIHHSRGKFFFRSYHMYMDLDSYAQVLSRLLTIVHLALVLIDASKVGNLFPEADVTAEVMADFEAVNRECFYGRSFGFQFVESLRKPLSFVQTAMAAFGDGFIRHNNSISRALSSMLHSGKYVVDPELRAKRIIELTQNASMDFCRAFWGLTEEYGVRHVPLIMCPALAVNHEFVVPPEPLVMETLDGGSVGVTLPLAKSNQKGVNARLLSFTWREGQALNSSSEKPAGRYSSLGQRARKRSRYLIFHCHGGGFVAQSSKSHEIYLRHWAKELKIPILSIDYSLAPDAPFPQALNEAFFAYCWALRNLDRLGSTGERICFCGDSAGANLVTAVVLKAIRKNIKLPDGLVLAYPPFNVQFVPSPSRLLALMDPLLPIGILKACLSAYAGSYVPSDVTDGCQKPVRTARFNEVFNPYDIDLGHRWSKSSYRFAGKCQSLSDSNLAHMKESALEAAEDGSYYSDFPCSSSTSSGNVKDASGFEDSYDKFDDGIRFDAKSSSLAKAAEVSNSLLERLKSEVVSDASFVSCDEPVTRESVTENASRLRRVTSLPYSAFLSLTSTVSSATSGVASYILGAAATSNPTVNAERNACRNADVLNEAPVANGVDAVAAPCPDPVLRHADEGEFKSAALSESDYVEKKESFGGVGSREMPLADLEFKQLEISELAQRVTLSQTLRHESLKDPSPVELASTASKSSTELSGVETAFGSGESVVKFRLCRECLRPTTSCKSACAAECDEPAQDRRRRRRHASHHRHQLPEHHHRCHGDLPVADRPDKRDVSEGTVSRAEFVATGDAASNRSRSSTCPSKTGVEDFEDWERDGEDRKRISVDLGECLLSKASSSRGQVDSCDTAQRNARRSFQTSKGQVHSDVKQSSEEQLSGVRDHPISSSTEEILKEAGKDPLISPLLASDDSLRRLPPVSVVACSLDPLFDDSVEFVRKLQKLDKKAELFVLDKLPHGFLNLHVLSAEARDGCDLVIACIKKAMDLGMRRNDSTSHELNCAASTFP